MSLLQASEYGSNIRVERNDHYDDGTSLQGKERGREKRER
jgi:hypothetical protein